MVNPTPNLRIVELENLRGPLIDERVNGTNTPAFTN